MNSCVLCDRTRPAVQERRETDRGELEGPVVDDDPEELGSPRRPCGRRGRALRPRRPPAEGAAASPAAGIEQVADGAGELPLVEVADDPGALDEADLAVLLRHDHDDRVGLLGDAERGTMARPEALGVDRRLGQRQEGARREDRLAADDDRAVVERRSAARRSSG